ncbi:MAG: deoxyuridine 5'-triphosphate nucleotidohydrolase [Clostridia bacterium]|nr:deoxyuridine 5'-triphosphate nucleotidohydrolase [Clostridia bacterium]
MNRIAKFYKVSNTQFGREGYENIILPRRATAGSAGYDFIAPYDFVLESGEEIVIDTGIRAKIAEGWVLVILPRSGSGFKYGVRLANTAGVIDSDYFNADNEGHIKIKLVGGNKTYTVKAGDAFAQGLFLPYGITEDDECTEERHGGFGSTDISPKNP